MPSGFVEWPHMTSVEREHGVHAVADQRSEGLLARMTDNDLRHGSDLPGVAKTASTNVADASVEPSGSVTCKPMSGPEAATVEHKLYWWKEAIIIAVFYAIYSFARNLFGSALVDAGQEPVHAFTNAMRVIRIEQAMGLFHEQTVQSWFLTYPGFIQFWNTFYGTAHFVVTIGAFVWMFRCDRADFPRWRNALGFTTALAIVGFSLFPLMPPRLLNNDGVYGGARIAAEQQREDFGFVDTLEEFGGPWSFDSGTMEKVSNQYAAMPSLHIAWSTWCAIVMWKLTRRRWARVLLVLYPLATLFCIVVTGNHFWLDGVGGLAVLAAGCFLGHELHEWNQRRQRDKVLRGLDAAGGAPHAADAGGAPNAADAGDAGDEASTVSDHLADGGAKGAARAEISLD
jgi:PAP2 superfamily